MPEIKMAPLIHSYSEMNQTEESPLMILDSVSYSINESGISNKSFFSSWLSGARSEKNTSSSISVTETSSTSNATHIIANNRQLLNNISMQIKPYEKISVIGPNGAGKSTLMKLILGLISPTSGKIIRHPELEIGYVPQKFTIPSILPLRVQDLLGQIKTRLNVEQHAYLFEQLSINPLLKKQVIHLSGGETQRVLLARSLLSKPNLLILDEPMQGLDPESERWLYEFIDDLPEFLQCAMVVVSHDLHWVMRGSRRVICLNKHICCEGQPSDLGISQEFKKLFGHQYVQPYIHRPHDCQHYEATIDQ